MKRTKLRQKDKDFIVEYVGINKPNYRRIARHNPAKLGICFEEVETDFKKIFDKKELELAINMAKDYIYNIIM